MMDKSLLRKLLVLMGALAFVASFFFFQHDVENASTSRTSTEPLSRGAVADAWRAHVVAKPSWSDEEKAEAMHGGLRSIEAMFLRGGVPAGMTLDEVVKQIDQTIFFIPDFSNTDIP